MHSLEYLHLYELVITCVCVNGEMFRHACECVNVEMFRHACECISAYEYILSVCVNKCISVKNL